MTRATSKTVSSRRATRMDASKARSELGTILNRVAFGRERVILRRHGKDVAAVVPVEDMEFIEELEKRSDLEAAQRALKEPGKVTWAKIKRDLGL